jgi:hypothetical protein
MSVSDDLPTVAGVLDRANVFCLPRSWLATELQQAI